MRHELDRATPWFTIGRSIVHCHFKPNPRSGAGDAQTLGGFSRSSHGYRSDRGDIEPPALPHQGRAGVDDKVPAMVMQVVVEAAGSVERAIVEIVFPDDLLHRFIGELGWT